MNQTVFVCSPFSAATPEGVQRNIEAAREYCAAIAAEGDVPFAPHLLFPQFLDDNDPAQREKGLRMSLHMLALCDRLACFRERLDATTGMRRELLEAQRLFIPVDFRPGIV